MSGLSLRELENELTSLASHMTSGMCRMLEIVGEVDRREAWTGWSSCAAWLAWRCGLNPRSAREQVRVARALRELPLIRESFSCGELTYSKVRALTRVATPKSEAELVDFAGVFTAAQLERALRAYARVSSEAAHELHQWEKLSYFWDDEGNLNVRARVAPEDGALILLCSRHHRLVHEGGYRVDEGHGFHDRWGRPIPTAPKPGNAATLRAANLRRGTAPKPFNNVSGDPMELDLAVDEIFKIFRQPP
jgi:hypothetical protein